MTVTVMEPQIMAQMFKHCIFRGGRGGKKMFTHLHYHKLGVNLLKPIVLHSCKVGISEIRIRHFVRMLVYFINIVPNKVFKLHSFIHSG